MNREQLEHIISAAGAISQQRDIIIIGSQALLGQFRDAPAELLLSMEADVFPRDKPELAEVIDGAIGELSPFHTTFNYYAHGVGPETAVLPQGAYDRLIPIRSEATVGITGWALEVHDLAVSKLVAGREKDILFVSNLLKHHLARREVLKQRLAQLADLSSRSLAEQRFQRL